MGYNLTREAVERYVPVFETILTAFKKDEDAEFDCPPEILSTEQYNLRQALKSAEIFSDMYGGKYSSLASRSTITVNSSHDKIVVKQKIHYNSVLAPPNERSAVAEIPDIKGSLHVFSFYPSPSFNEEHFLRVVENKGWKIFIKGKVVEDGKYSYPAERIDPSTPDTKKSGGFSAILDNLNTDDGAAGQ